MLYIIDGRVLIRYQIKTDPVLFKCECHMSHHMQKGVLNVYTNREDSGDVQSHQNSRYSHAVRRLRTNLRQRARGLAGIDDWACTFE